jgi:VCBS repeat-containing protein
MLASQIVRSRTLSLLALIGMLMLAGALVPHSATAQNLISNPSAETSAPSNDIGTSDDIADWTETTGVFSRPDGDFNDWLPFSDGSIGSTDGANVFVLNTRNPDTGSEFNLQQDITGVSVSGGITYDFSGDIKTFSPDEARIIVEYRNGSGTVLDSYDSGYQGTSGSFATLTDSRTAPARTNLIRVRLVARENGGSNNFNDAFFDNLSLTAQSAPLIADDDGPFVTETPDDLSVAAPGLLGNDALGDPSGDIASFGGGDLGGSVTSNAAGSSASLAGGTLTVDADGSLVLSTPTDIGTYTFNYRLSNGSEQSDGTVTLEVTRNNLIANPSAENVEGSNDSIVDWTETPATLSNGQANTWIGFDEDGVTAGLRSFAPQPVNPDNGSTFNLQQDVTGGPVTGGTTFEFSADAKSIGSDDVRVILEYRDGGGNVLDSYDSGFLSTGGATTQLTDTRTAPSGTALIRVRLQGRENGGTDNGLDFADAFVDNLRLFASAAPLNAANDGPFATPANSTLSRTAPGLLLNDSRGTPEGTLASFGGGDLGGSVTSNAAGSTVTLAGGTLTVNADGSFTLDTPTVQGTYTFDYRLSNGSEQSDATATIEVQPATGDNLLLNPSAENTTSEDDSGTANDVASWTEQPGQLATGTTNDWLSFDESGATDGANAFTTEPVFPDASSEFNLQQDVTGSEVQGGRAYAFAGDMKSTGPDDVRMVVEYRDGGTILDSYDTGYQDTGGTFTTVSDTRTAPAGTDAIRVRLLVREEGGTTDFAEGVFDNLSLTVSNTPIQFQASGPASLTVDEDAGPTSLNGTLSADDPDDDQTIAWSVASGPSNGTLDGLPTTASAGGSGITPTGVTYTPNADFSGTDAFTIRVSDGTAEDLLNFDVTVNNLAPVFTSSATATFAEGSTGTALDNDATNGGDGTADSGVTYSISGTDAGAFTIDSATGELSFSTPPDFGSPTDAGGNNEYVVDVTADDGEASNNTTTQTVTITVTDVNEDPAFANGASTSFSVDEDANATGLNALLEVSDVDGGQTLTWSVTSSPSNGTLSGFNATASSGGTAIQPSGVTYEPNTDFVGSDSFEIQVSDGNGGTDNITVNVTVNAINDRPTITAPSGPLQPTEDVAFDLTGANEIQVADIDAGISDVELSLTANNGTLTLGATSNLAFESGSNGTEAFTVSGTIGEINNALTTLTYQGNPDYNGTETIEVVINDRGNTGADPGISGDGSSEEATASIDVDVQPVPDDPTITTLPDQTTDEDVTLSGIGFTVGDAETAAGNLTLSFSADTPSLIESHTFGGSGADRTLSITPADNQNGVLNVTVTVTDESGRTASDVFRLTINAVNDLPTVSPAISTFDDTVQEDDPVPAISFTVSDVESGGAGVDVTASSDNQTLVPDANLSVTNNGGGDRTLDVTPAANESGTATITVTLDDGTDTVDDSFTLTVNPANDAPTITAIGNRTIDEDTNTGAIGFTVGDVETTDLTTLTLTATSSDQTLVPDANIALTGPGASGAATVTVTPAPDENGGPATITVTADDGGRSADETFDVTVTPTNDAPSISGDLGIATNEGTAVALTRTDLEANDPDDGAADLTYTVTSTPSNGAIQVGGSPASSFTEQQLSNGTVAYVHDGSETTSDAFDVELADGGEDGAGTATAAINVDVNAQNDAPTISSIADKTITEDETLSSLSFTVGDAETSDLSTLTLSGSSDNTTLVPTSNIPTSNIRFTGPDASGDASITVEPAANESGTATITVTVDDGSASNSTARESFVLTVEGVVDLAITDGAAPNLDFTASVSPGTDDNAVGLFQLTGGQGGATLTDLTVTSSAPGVDGITAASLFLSTDETFEPGSDTRLQEISTDSDNAPETYDFTGLSRSVPTSGGFFFVAIDVATGASDTDIRFLIDDPADLTVADGELAAVNGGPASSIPDLFLSSSSAQLPVEMAAFTAQSNAEAVSLRWTTASESGNAGFDVQRRVTSASGNAWTTLGTRPGAGTTEEPQTYRFEDIDVPYAADSLTYRLRQIDEDGSESFPGEVTIARSAVEEMQLLGTYPNPARRQATVRYALPKSLEGEVKMQLFDVLGRQVRAMRPSADAGRHEIQLDVSTLPSGLYVLRLTAGSAVKTQRMTVVR